MKRRDLLKSFLAAPFVWLFKGKKSGYSCSSSDGGGSSSPSVSSDLYPKAKANLRDFDAHLVLGDDFDEVDLMCGGQNGTLCPRCKFNCKTDNIELILLLPAQLTGRWHTFSILNEDGLRTIYVAHPDYPARKISIPISPEAKGFSFDVTESINNQNIELA